jgi:hypothetical protein
LRAIASSEGKGIVGVFTVVGLIARAHFVEILFSVPASRRTLDNFYLLVLCRHRFLAFCRFCILNPILPPIMSFNFTESNPSNDYPISPLDTEGFGYQVGFPDNLISYNFMPNSISNDLQISHPDAPHNDTSSKHDAAESIVANELNASTSHDLNYDVSLKDDLNKAFKAIKAPGTFAVWGALPTTPPAGLNVEGVGDVALPLQEEKIRQLIDKSHQAPYGRRSETLVDVSVRNTWEINGDQLHFFDPAWLHYLLDLSKRVATDLGIEAPIRLDLYKMLIYETGAMFKAHTE